jgi:Cd2+/Zn2+-exporting ATPase
MSFVDDEKKENDLYMTEFITVDPSVNLGNNSNDSNSNTPYHMKMVPGQGAFHPDFMFCGECTDCSKVVEENVNDNTDNDIINNNNVTITKLLLTHTWKNPKHEKVVQSLLQHIPSVMKVEVHLLTTLRTVIVHHEAASMRGTTHAGSLTHVPDQCVSVLQQGGYPCTVASIQDQNDAVAGDELMGRQQFETAFVVRSTFLVTGICCASEVPSIRKIVKPVAGVASLQINIATKQVYVQHDVQQLGAAEIATRLTAHGFPASIVKNGADTLQNAASKNKNDIQQGVGRTTLHCQGRSLHPQDVQRIQQKLWQVTGVKRIGVNVVESVIYVDHAVAELSAAELAAPLLPEYPTVLVQDAVQDIANTATALYQQPRSKYVESTLIISNLTGRHVTLLHKAVTQHYIRAQIRALIPHVSSHTVKLEHNPDLIQAEDVCTCLARYGLDAHVLTDGAVEKLALPLLEEDSNEQEQAAAALQEWQTNQLRSHVVLSGVFWVVSMLSAISGLEFLEYFGLLSVLFGLPPVAIKAFRTVRRCEFDANCMMVVAALGALALGEFGEAASVSFLFAVSEYLESIATDKARKALAAIVNLRPDHANVIHPSTKEIVVVPADRVPIGSLISVRTGDKVAADGVVVEGTSSVDESSLTGESVPVRKTIDDEVLGGSINIGTTQLVVRTTSSVEDSAVSRLIRLVEEAQANRSPTEKMIDGFARAYTPAVVLLAALMCTLPWFFGTETGRYWTLNGLIIIVIACPCALTISTPVTYAAGLAACAQRGIVVKGGASLEALGSVETVILDKTGTITEGKFNVTHLEEVGDTRTRKEMLGLLALMEAPSSHPLSATLVKAAKREGVSVPADAVMTEHTILKGEGVMATVDGKQVYVGNRLLFERIGMYENLPQAYQGLAVEWGDRGGTVGFLGVEGEGIIGAFSMTDLVRDEAKETIETLMMRGVKVLMLTGDGEGAAKAVGRQVGLGESSIHFQLSPEDKLHYLSGIKQTAPSNSFGLFRRQPKILFCGDGVNDAPALAVADVGVSMGEGAALALEMSDVTLMDSNLSKLVYVIEMGTRVMFTVQENIILSLICKTVVVALTFGGYMTLLYAIASDVGVMLLVTLNGMKLLPGETGDALRERGRRQGLKKYYDQVPLVGTLSPTGVAEIV